MTDRAQTDHARSGNHLNSDVPTGPASVLGYSVESLLGEVASDRPTPGGGAVAGCVTALAAGLASMAGRFAMRLDPADRQFAELVERTESLRHHAARLVDDDIAAYGGFAAAAALPREPDSQDRRAALRTALDTAAQVPADVTSVAEQVAEIGHGLVMNGNPRLRSDAFAATALAAAAAMTGAVLVAENLHGHDVDSLVETTRARADRAVRHAATALSQLSDE